MFIMYKIKQKPEDFVVNEITNVRPLKQGNFLLFRLKKKNYTTNKAVETIAKKLHIPPKFIGYAGNKDKKAITTQLVSIKGRNREGIENLKLKDISLIFEGYLDKPISLGDLKGNEFVIRVITNKKPRKAKKILNLFGEQRFGTNNKEVGKAIVKKDFKKAVKLLGLDVKENDFVGALRTIPKKILRLYIHAYQSYLWNEMAKDNETAKYSKGKKLPIIGFATEPDEKINRILKKEGITTRDFIIRQIPELSSEGTERELYTEIKDLVIRKEKDSYILRFRLKKGSYATVVVDFLFNGL